MKVKFQNGLTLDCEDLQSAVEYAEATCCETFEIGGKVYQWVDYEDPCPNCNGYGYHFDVEDAPRCEECHGVGGFRKVKFETIGGQND